MNIKIGRNFTNTFVFDVLSKDEQELISNQTENLFSMNAFGLVKFKENVKLQIDLIKKYDMNLLELDGDVPNPYLKFNDDECSDIKQYSIDNNVELSLHLGYSGVGSNICNLQEEERVITVEYYKQYLVFANKIGVKNIVFHPGSVAFYMVSDRYKKLLNDQLKKSISEMLDITGQYGMNLHIENNVAFDNYCIEPQEILEIIEWFDKKGRKIYFNFDIGHWFTRQNIGRKIEFPPESILRLLPVGVAKEFHLNDFVTENMTFHPPLYKEKGLLKKENLMKYFAEIRRLKVENIILETAFKELDDVLNREQIIKEETEYIKNILKEL